MRLDVRYWASTLGQKEHHRARHHQKEVDQALRYLTGGEQDRDSAPTTTSGAAIASMSRTRGLAGLRGSACRPAAFAVTIRETRHSTARSTMRPGLTMTTWSWMTTEAAKAPHQTAAGLSYASGTASRADLTAGQRAQGKCLVSYTRISP
jgi:hypothetical protein